MHMAGSSLAVSYVARFGQREEWSQQSQSRPSKRSPYSATARAKTKLQAVKFTQTCSFFLFFFLFFFSP